MLHRMRIKCNSESVFQFRCRRYLCRGRIRLRILHRSLLQCVGDSGVRQKYSSVVCRISGSSRLVATVRQGEQFLPRFPGQYQLPARHAGKETVEEELFLSSSDGYRPSFSGSGLISRSSLVFSLEQEVGVPS